MRQPLMISTLIKHQHYLNFQEPVNENNTKSVSRKLRQIAGNSGKITNKMDVNLIVNITENIADVKNIPRQVRL